MKSNYAKLSIYFKLFMLYSIESKVSLSSCFTLALSIQLLIYRNSALLLGASIDALMDYSDIFYSFSFAVAKSLV